MKSSIRSVCRVTRKHTASTMYLAVPRVACVSRHASGVMNVRWTEAGETVADMFTRPTFSKHCLALRLRSASGQ